MKFFQITENYSKSNRNHHYHFCYQIALMVMILIFSSCQPPTQKSKASDKISQHERDWLTPFFNDIMLFQQGIYTLWGAHKPITIIPVSNYSEEELKALHDARSENVKNENSFSVDVVEGYKLSEAWKKWEQISHRFPMNRFMLFKMEDKEDPHVYFLVFIDVLKTAAVIQNNYESFHKTIGYDFHPLEFTLQMNQKDSTFWKNLNSYLYGLLFGFGKTNSQLYHWKYFDHPKICDKFCKNIEASFSNGQLKGLVKFTIDDLKIPYFMSFNEIDPIVNIYQEERKMIQETYKNKDFLDLTLKKLTE